MSNRAAMLAKLADLETEVAKAVAGGGEKYVERHHARGKLLPRERIELLVDEGSAFLELSPLAGWGSDFHVGASLVTGIGVVEGVECLITANDPTVKGGASNPWTVKKAFRAAQIAEENHLPTISLVESGGADLPTQKEIFIPGGKLFRDLTRRQRPAAADDRAGVRQLDRRRRVRAGHERLHRDGQGAGQGVPRRPAAGEDGDRRGVRRRVARRRRDARPGLRPRRLPRPGRARRDPDRPADRGAAELAQALAVVAVAQPLSGRCGADAARLDHLRRAGPDPDGLLDLIPADLKEPFDPREVIVRICDGTGPGNGRPFDEFKPLYGTSLVTGWARLHGRPIGILANAQGVLFSEEAQKATQFIQLANQVDTPLLFLHNTTGYMVGAEYEQGGIIKHGAQMINAVSNSKVPHLSVIMGASYGAGNYGMNGRAYDPRFLFTWPSAKSAVMGPAQLAGVLSIVARAAAEARGQAYDEEGDAGMRAFVEQSVEEQSLPFFLSGMLYDDGVIDPRDTRTVLAICLSVIENAPIRGAEGYGVFRT